MPTRLWTLPASTLPGPIVRLETLHEQRPGPGWSRLHETIRPALHRWYSSHGLASRPSLEVGRAALERWMPELRGTWGRLVQLAGDELTARLLTLWDTPPFLSGCTQAAVGGPAPVLVRNYDYAPALLEGVVASTDWSGNRRVLGTSDLLWGLLDGMNGDGLVVSFTWGGRTGHAPGFAIPLVVRYLLETAADVPSALHRLAGIPVAQAYNLTLLDSTGEHASAFVAPGARLETSHLEAVANHRLEVVEDPAAWRIRSPQRQRVAARAAREADRGAGTAHLVEAFLSAPVHSTTSDHGFPTLYTAAYSPTTGTLTYHWPGQEWVRRFEDRSGSRTVHLR